jgi:hypothetical protein
MCFSVLAGISIFVPNSGGYIVHRKRYACADFCHSALAKLTIAPSSQGQVDTLPMAVFCCSSR